MDKNAATTSSNNDDESSFNEDTHNNNNNNSSTNNESGAEKKRRRRRVMLYNPHTYNVEKALDDNYNEPALVQNLAQSDDSKKDSSNPNVIVNDSTTANNSNITTSSSNDKSIPSGQVLVGVEHHLNANMTNDSSSLMLLNQNVASESGMMLVEDTEVAAVVVEAPPHQAVAEKKKEEEKVTETMNDRGEQRTNQLSEIQQEHLDNMANAIMNHQFDLNPDDLQDFLIEEKSTSSNNEDRHNLNINKAEPVLVHN